MPIQRYLLRKVGMVVFAMGLIFLSNSSQAGIISGYNDLILLYTKGFSEDEQAAFKQSIKDLEEDALNDILKKEINSTYTERQYIFRQSDSIPTRIFHFDNKYTVIGFEKTLHYKGTWEKSAYMLLFETKGPQHLKYADSYKFWKGKNSVEEYKGVSEKDLCKYFPDLAQTAECGNKKTVQIAKVEKKEERLPEKQPVARPVEPVQPKVVAKPVEPKETKRIPAPVESKPARTPKKELTAAPNIAELKSRLDQIERQVQSKAERRHSHNARDITSGIIKESFIDAAIARDGELTGPERVAFSDADETYVKSLENRIMELENTVRKLSDLLEGVSRDQNTILFSGVNVQVVNGTGTTNGSVNGLGNVIVGYNQIREGGDEIERTGSHNLVVGDGHGYSSYGGFVAGLSNTISGAYSSVSGGLRNVASGDYSSVSGGHFKTAEGIYAVSQPDEKQPVVEEKKERACFISILSGLWSD